MDQLCHAIFLCLYITITIGNFGERITLDTKEGVGESFNMPKELFVNGELTLTRKETHRKGAEITPVFTSRMEKREYHKNISHFDIRNVLDVNALLKDIKKNWNTYVSQVSRWIQSNPAKKLIVTGIFTIVLGVFASTSSAAFIEEYTYQVKSSDKIEKIATEHGVTPQEILDANGLTLATGKKILLPKVQDRIVTAKSLNVRSKPNTESSIVGKYKKGEVVKVAFVENGWAGVLIKGKVRFVSADYLTQKPETGSETSQATRTFQLQAKPMYVTASSLKIREAASTNSSVLDFLKSDEMVSVLSINNGWAKIRFNEKEAFVSAAYLTEKETTKTVNKEHVNEHTDKKIRTSEYEIKKGDTYTKVGKEHGVSAASIQELNPALDPTKLKIGQTIKIPTKSVNQIKVPARIKGVDPKGTFRFITPNGNIYSAKASGVLLEELFQHEGEKLHLTLEGKRGQQLNLVTLH